MIDSTNTLHQELSELMARGVDIDSARHFGERGYAKEQGVEEDILLANWNEVSDDLYSRLEEAGYTLLWSDEWYLDHDYNKVWRTESDSYWWRPSIAWTDAGVLTPDDDAENWFDQFHNEALVMPEAAPVPEDMRLVRHIRNTGNAVELERSLKEELNLVAGDREDVLFRYEGTMAVAMFTRDAEEEDNE